MKLLGIHGAKHTGKDTLFLLLSGKMKARRFAFADALKEELGAALGLTVAELNADKEKYRKAMQEHGQMRRSQDEHYWVKMVMDQLIQLIGETDDLLVVTDVRHENEALMIRLLGGVIVEIIRPGLPRTDSHISEQPLPRELVDIRVWNNSTPSGLCGPVLEFLRSKNLA